MPFEKGKSGNPAGRPSGHQAFVDRARKFLEQYTVEELLALTRDRERFGKLSVYDGIIVSRLALAFSKGGGADMDRILDRVIGKPSQPLKVQAHRTTLEELLTGNFEDDEGDSAA